MDIHEYPKLIEDGSAELYKASERHRRVTEGIKRIELQTLMDVASMVTGTGKPLYSNESARAAGVQFRLDTHEPYQSLLEEQAEAHQQRAVFEATIQRLRDEFRVALIDYEFTKLGARVK